MQQMTSTELYLRLLKYVAPYWRVFALSLAGMVIVGRPYNIHDAGLNISVTRKLRDSYGVNLIPIDALPDARGLAVLEGGDHNAFQFGNRHGNFLRGEQLAVLALNHSQIIVAAHKQSRMAGECSAGE